MWRKVRKLFIWTVSIFISLIFVLAFVIWLMQDKIKGYAINYLNSNLKTELKTDAIDVTFLSTFPKTTLHFKNIRILDPKNLQPYRDTLFSADDVYIKFNLWDIFSGNYKAKTIDVYHAYIRTFINKAGEENYDIVKKSTDKSENKKAFELDLKSVQLFNSRITYHNVATAQQYKFKTEQLKLTGNFNDENIKLNANGDVFINELRNKNITLFKNQKSDLNLNFSISSNGSKIKFEPSNWKIGKLELGVKGEINQKEEKSFFDVEIFGKNIPLISVLQFLPNESRKHIDRYKSFGNLNLKLNINGTSDKKTSPDVIAGFSIANGILIEKKTNVSLHNIDLKGNYTNRNKLNVDELVLEKFSARFKDGKIKAKLKITDFNRPHFIAEISGNTGLATVNGFLNETNVEEVKGEVNLDGKIDFVLLRTDDLLLTNTVINEASGKVIFSNATLKLQEIGTPITNLNGELQLKNDDALVDGLSGKINATDFSINGAIKNFTPFILSGNSQLLVVGAFNSTNFEVEDILGNVSETDKKQLNSEHERKIEFPDNIHFNFDIAIEQLKWDTFKASNIKGNFKLIDKILNATELKIQMAGGECSGNINVDGTNEGPFLVTATTDIQNVELPKMLSLFKNFGQDLLTAQNTKGLLTAQVYWGMLLARDLKIDENKMIAQATVKVEKGELNELEQLNEIANFMRTDKKLKLFLKNDADYFQDKVKNLKFELLKNTLSIDGGNLIIPEMDINSSALKLKFSGSHTFDNKIDYHFNFRFTELKSQRNNVEFGEIADDGTGIKIFIHMFGSLNNPNFEWDKEERKEERSEQWKNEKKTVKSILKEEFGLFKRDTTVHIEEQKKENIKFMMEWDENKIPDQKQEEQRKNDKERIKKLKKRLGIDEKSSNDVKFEIKQ